MNPWKNKFVLGITGGMGSGKSTVTRIFESFGCHRISSDELARFYTSADSPIKAELVRLFGEESVKNGVPDRKIIAGIVFSDPVKLNQLTEIIHPLVRKQAVDFFESLPEGSIAVWEVPLLFETRAEEVCSSTLTVCSDEKITLNRVIERDGITEKEYKDRMARQMELKEKIKRSDFVVRNDFDMGVLETE
ncbi:MAG TPA: dephospho-CoA kinase, partial [Leptospiraceae bacterium]|nr:dephospho-CoA kinase [Leptospiraceae bacterium]